MTFNIEKAVQRIGWRIKEKHWKCNQNDLDAYNFVVNYVKKQQDIIINSNELFAKLYIHMYFQYLMSYGSDFNNPIPKSILNKELSKPIQQHIQEFYELSNEVSFIKKVDSDLKNIKLEDMQKFDYDFIHDNLVKQINEVILKHCEWKN